MVSSTPHYSTCPISNSGLISKLMGRLSTFSQHQASVMMIMLIMSTVNNWLAILTFNPENVINSPRAHHAGVIERRVAHCEQ